MIFSLHLKLASLSEQSVLAGCARGVCRSRFILAVADILKRNEVTTTDQLSEIDGGDVVYASGTSAAKKGFIRSASRVAATAVFV